MAYDLAKTQTLVDEAQVGLTIRVSGELPGDAEAPGSWTPL